MSSSTHISGREWISARLDPSSGSLPFVRLDQQSSSTQVGPPAIDREQVFRDEEGGVPLLGTALYDAIINTVEGPLSGRTSRSMTGAEATPRAAS